jgi:polar amino acid transport system substrate-binding protein
MIRLLTTYCMIISAGFTILLSPRIARPADQPLISSVAKENKDGVAKDIIKAIARKLNVKLKIKYAPFKRRLHMMQNGEIDFMAGLLKRPEREKFIYYLSPPYSNRSDTVFFVQRGKASLVRTYKDLYHLRIGTHLGSKYFPKFDNDTALAKDAVTSSIGNFKKLMSGRIDTVVFPESAGIDLIHETGIDGRVEAADYRYTKERRVYIGISKKSRLMNRIKAVEKTIRKMIESGELKRFIVDHYVSRGLMVPDM